MKTLLKKVGNLFSVIIDSIQDAQMMRAERYIKK
jgi:hypothetical protein